MKEYISLLAPFAVYILVYFIRLGPKYKARRAGIDLRSLRRKANGCYKETCIDYPPKVHGIECEVDPEHWRVHKGSRISCSQSRAIISNNEMTLITMIYSKRNELIRHLLAIAAMVATIIAAFLKNGH